MKRNGDIHILGIDPGKQGAFAVYENGEVTVVKMPATIQDTYRELHRWRHCVCYLERVGFHQPGNAVSSSTTFARHCGHLEALLVASSIPFGDVSPQKWMGAVITSKLPADKRARKNLIKDAMQRRYPQVSVTLWNADALGVMTYGVMMERGGGL